MWNFCDVYLKMFDSELKVCVWGGGGGGGGIKKKKRKKERKKERKKLNKIK